MADPAFNGSILEVVGDNVSSISGTHTINTILTNSMVIVMCNNRGFKSGSPPVMQDDNRPTGCTFGGTPMVFLFSINGDYNPAFFLLQNPPSGNSTVTLSFTHAAWGACMTVATLVNVSQKPFPRWAISEFHSNDATTTATIPFTVYPNSMLVGWTLYRHDTVYSSTDQTLLDGPFFVPSDAPNYDAATFYGLNATSITVNWTVAGKTRNLSAIAIPPVPQSNYPLNIL